MPYLGTWGHEVHDAVLLENTCVSYRYRPCLLVVIIIASILLACPLYSWKCWKHHLLLFIINICTITLLPNVEDQSGLARFSIYLFNYFPGPEFTVTRKLILPTPCGQTSFCNQLLTLAGWMMQTSAMQEPSVAFDCTKQYSLPLTMAELDDVLPSARQINGNNKPLFLQSNLVSNKILSACIFWHVYDLRTLTSLPDLRLICTRWIFPELDNSYIYCHLKFLSNASPSMLIHDNSQFHPHFCRWMI